MRTTEEELAKTLRERLAIIADEKSRQSPDEHVHRLREISNRIEKLTAALPRPIAPSLAHYLERCSYDKALEFLEGRAPSRP